MFLTSNPGLTCWKHLISVFLFDSSELKRNEPGVYTFPHTSTNSQIPTVEVACFVVSQITPCISEALLSFHWMRSRFISSIQKLIKLFQKISFIPCQFNWPILIADSGCAFVIENRFLSQSSKLIWSEFVFNIYTVTGQPIFIENIFSRILSVPERRTSKQIRDWSELFWNEFSYQIDQSRICLGLPKFRFKFVIGQCATNWGPPFGDTQNPREINFYKNGLSCYGV